MQNYNNPQTLNRYSYCTNNPLIYTDPSGRIVEFENTNQIHELLLEGPNGPSWCLVQDYFALVGAWVSLGTEVPELTSYLENRPETIVIGSADLSAKSESGETLAFTLIGGNITIDTGTIDMGLNVTTAILGHEALHAAFEVSRVGVTLDSIAEEAFCYNMQYSLDVALTGSCSNTLAVACQSFNPWLPVTELNQQLTGKNGIKKTLRKGGYGFGYTLWPFGPALGSQDSLIQTARKFFPSPYDFYFYC